MMQYTERNIGNQPQLIIYGHSIDHIMSANHFKRMANPNKGVTIEVDSGTVYMRTGSETRGVIGWIVSNKVSKDEEHC